MLLIAQILRILMGETFKGIFFYLANYKASPGAAHSNSIYCSYSKWVRNLGQRGHCSPTNEQILRITQIFIFFVDVQA